MTLAADPFTKARHLSEVSGLPLMVEADWPERINLPPDLSLAFLSSALLLPLAVPERGAVPVAVCNPHDTEALVTLERAIGRPLDLRIATQPALQMRLDRLLHAHAPQAGTHGSATEVAELGEAEDASDVPAIRMLDKLLVQAVGRRATDIHFEPSESGMTLRQRVDGMLATVATVPPAMGRALVSRMKILAGMDIAEQRMAQDGHLRQSIGGRLYDLRCATLPLVSGEGLSIRILATAQSLPSIDRLGLSSTDEAVLRSALGRPNGLVLVTGPTGSGKTTTLAAAVALLNDPVRKIMSIEDPVEYRIAGVSQMQVNAAVGLDFAAALRAFLRADPDIIVVGEIRDAKTARIAVQAAMTGHLVLTTLHTNSAAGAAMRLLDMGVEHYLLAAGLAVSIGQRLVRRLCLHCAKAAQIVPPFAPEILRRHGLTPGKPVPAWHSVGCDHCGGTGYFGRLALFEVMPVTDDLRAMLRPGTTTAALHSAAIAAGMTALTSDGLRQALAGQTTFAEVLRVVQDA